MATPPISLHLLYLAMELTGYHHVPQTFPGVFPPGKPFSSFTSHLWRLTVSLSL